MNHLKAHGPRETLGSATGAVLPDIAINAVEGRFEVTFVCPDKEVDIRTLRWRCPKHSHGFFRTEHCPEAPQCNEVIANSLLFDPMGNQ